MLNLLEFSYYFYSSCPIAAATLGLSDLCRSDLSLSDFCRSDFCRCDFKVFDLGYELGLPVWCCYCFYFCRAAVEWAVSLGILTTTGLWTSGGSVSSPRLLFDASTPSAICKLLSEPSLFRCSLSFSFMLRSLPRVPATPLLAPICPSSSSSSPIILLSSS